MHTERHGYSCKEDIWKTEKEGIILEEEQTWQNESVNPIIVSESKKYFKLNKKTNMNWW